jgi:hypothetical protein
MPNAKKEFFRRFGVRPRDIEPSMNQQQMWDMIRKNDNKKRPSLDVFKNLFEYRVVELHPEDPEPYILLERKSADGTVQQAYIWGKFNPDKVLERAPHIAEYEWGKPD